MVPVLPTRVRIAISVTPTLFHKRRELGLSSPVARHILFPTTSDSLESEASIKILQEELASKSGVGRQGGLALGYCEKFDPLHIYKSECRCLIPGGHHRLACTVSPQQRCLLLHHLVTIYYS